MSVFADTSSLHAAIVQTEEHHAACLTLLEDLLSGGRAIQTTNYVITEIVALLQHRIGLEPVRDFEEQILPLITVFWVQKDLHQRGMRSRVFLLSFSGQPLPWDRRYRLHGLKCDQMCFCFHRIHIREALHRSQVSSRGSRPSCFAGR